MSSPPNKHSLPLGLALAVLLLSMAAVPLASAHAVPAEQFPAIGARLQEPPADVWVTFTEAPDPATIELSVIGQSLERVDLGDVEVVHATHARVSLPDALPQGGYLVRWEAFTQSDGHQMEGAWPFVVGQGPMLQSGATLDAPAFPWTGAAGKALMFTGVAALLGAIASQAYVLRRPAPAAVAGRLTRIASVGAGLQLAGLLALLASQVRLSGLDAGHYLWGTVFGRGLAVRLALAAAFLAWLAAPGRRTLAWASRVDVGLAAATLLAYGWHSHTAGALPAVLGALIDGTHLGAVAVWTGGLACLAVVLRSGAMPAQEAQDAAHRFSGLATACVALMAATGLAMMGAILGWDPAAWRDALGGGYGRLLAAMVAAGLGMAALGAASKYRFLAAFARDPGEAHRRRLRANVGREAAVGLCVLLVAAALTNLAPVDAPAAPAVAAAQPTLVDVRDPCKDAPERVDCLTDSLLMVQALYGSPAALDLTSQLAADDPSLAGPVHFIAHALGHTAYDTTKDIQKTIRECSYKQMGGCVHGALESHFQQQANLTREAINGACPPDSAFLLFECQHAIGHGIMLARDNALFESLELCDLMDTVQGAINCHTGVFMTNVVSAKDEKDGAGNATFLDAVLDPSVGHHRTGARPLYKEDDHAYPCDAVEAMHQNACWSQQPQLIYILNGANFTDLLAKCEAYPATEMQKHSCSSGSGNMAEQFVGNQPLPAMPYCDLAPTAPGRSSCLWGVFQQAVNGLLDPRPVLSLCGDLPAGDAKLCAQAAGNAGSRVTDAARMEAACEAAGAWADACRAGAGLNRA